MRIDRIKFATELARADLNIKQLAERAGVSRVTITSIKGESLALRQRRRSWRLV